MVENLTAKPFWGLTAFFNPQRYRCRKRLYDIFRQGTRSQGLPLLTVELAFGSAPFELSAGDSEILIQLRAEAGGVMWQKERLLNIGLSHLPTECESVAWLDCDVIFDNSAWVDETAELLGRYAVVQPFSIGLRLARGQTKMRIQAANHPSYDRRPSSGYACTYGQGSRLTDYMSAGHTGFAWAAHKSLFDGIGFYDKMILGGGDVILACGFYGRPTNRFTHLLPLGLRQDQEKWIEAMAARVRGSVGYTRGGLLHLWHGVPRTKPALSRFEPLARHAFDPHQDIRATDRGYFVWDGRKRELQEDVACYFRHRNEDEGRLHEWIYRRYQKLATLPGRWRRLAASQLGRVTVQCQMALTTVTAPEKEKMTLIIMNWKRPQMVSMLVDRYSKYSSIADIIVWNNNPESMPDLAGHRDVKVVTCKHDAGLDSRWAAGVLADREHLLIHDDDLILTENAVTLLFRKYLRNPHLCHGICGRNLTDRYNLTNVFGRVDIALTTCLIVNRKYVYDYFRHVAAFDDLRNHGCGNGEDIVMNYVVRSVTGEKSRAYRIPYTNANRDSAVSMFSIGRRPGHLAVRNEIARRCVEHLTGEKANLLIQDFGLDELQRVFPAAWLSYHEEPEAIARKGNFTLSENVCGEKFARALSLLCRRTVTEAEIGRAKA